MADDLVLDLTNYKDTTGAYVAPGRYAVVVEDAELGESSQKKTPQLTVWLKIVGGEFDGSTLIDNLYLTEGSKFRIVGFLQALGIPTPKKRLTFQLRQFIGRRLYVIVEDDDYQNRKRSRVTTFERLIVPGGSSEPVDEFAGLEEETAAPAAAPAPAAEAPAAAAAAAPTAEAPAAAAAAAAAPAQPAESLAATAAPDAEDALPAAAPADPWTGEDEDSIDLDDLEL